MVGATGGSLGDWIELGIKLGDRGRSLPILKKFLALKVSATFYSGEAAHP